LSKYILSKENIAVEDEIQLLKSAVQIIQTITCDNHKKQVVLALVKLIEQKEALTGSSFDKEGLVKFMEEITLLKRVMENMEWDCLSEAEREEKYKAILSMGRK
jgi:hypothetical protein